ncbi:OmpA family protein [Histidinibacterium lentulum]|uniref:OmpA family protein n=1 Tax=Histidinibacterium lentulum TaxID=2480588 RepID=A0A3N2QYV6_9RHOB|nr:OmpA family protein [Histidinibacterium lentulum]ROU00266.1 OmpA family protein [Histidinibacterium lentulum]
MHMNALVPALVTSLALLAGPASAQDGPKDYSDGARGTVTLPQGDRSFADRVVSYTAGTGTISPSASDPRVALGPPDFSGDVNDGTFVSLGCDGTLVLQFEDNAIIDVDGPDHYVFEVGPNVEGTALAVSEDGTDWIDLGQISGGRAEIDLSGVAPADTSFRFVRLTDDGIESGTRYAGADIDAVAAIGSSLRFVLDGAVLFAVDSTELRAEALAALDDLAEEIAAARLDAFRVVGHTDSAGSDEYNNALSQARALAVRDYLSGLPVLSGVTIRAEGRGETEPVADNGTDDGRALNRRVEIIGY